MKQKDETQQKESYVEKIKNKDGLVIKVRTYNYEPSKTQQQFKDAHDINNIMKKYQKAGISYNHLPAPTGTYGDFTNLKSYQESVQAAIDADSAFMTLPSSVRKRFNNNPQELFDFLNDKQNYDEAVKLGLIEKPVKIEAEIPVQPPSEAPGSTPKK